MTYYARGPVQTGWINIDLDISTPGRRRYFASEVFNTREEADERAGQDRAACMCVEFRDGYGLETAQ